MPARRMSVINLTEIITIVWGDGEMKPRLTIGLLLVAVLLGGCAWFRPKPDETANRFVEYWKGGQYEEMYRLLTEERQVEVSEADFVKRYRTIYDAIGRIDLRAKLAEPAKGKYEVKENRTAIPVTGAIGTSTVGDILLDQLMGMVYEKKEWRIDWRPTLILPQLKEWEYRVKVTHTAGERGHILDRNGELLAGAGDLYKIGLVPGKIQDRAKAVAGLAALLHLSPQRIEQQLNQKWVKPESFVPLRSITRDDWQARKAQFLAVPGMLAASERGRSYFGPESLAATIGYLGEVSSKELETLTAKGYRSGDRVGRDGLEEKFEAQLAGKSGFTVQFLDGNGYEADRLSSNPRRGQDLTLTIDLKLQQALDRAMGDRRGAAVALNPKTGEVLALASFPGYDPNEFNLGGGSTEVSRILDDPEKPLLNRVIQGKYIPGSTFKPLTALAALEFDPQYDPARKVELPQSTWQPDASWGNYVVRRVPRPAGPVDLHAAMKWSDNIYFARLAYAMGSEPLFQMAERAGFDQTIPFTLEAAKSRLASNRPIANGILLADTGYGQGQVLMTPLHLALIYGAFGTDGRLRQPVLLTTGEKGKIWREEPLGSEEHLALLRDVLKVTVQDPKALAHDADVAGLDLAGKTGTAQGVNKEEMGWFVSYHPAADPKMVLVIGVEEAARGSHDAIDIMKKALTEYYRLKP